MPEAGGVDARKGRRRIHKATNAFQARLVGVLRRWQARVTPEVQKALKAGKPKADIMALVDIRLLQLAADLEELNQAAMIDAYVLGNGKAPDARGLALISEQVEGFTKGIEDSLLPRLRAKIEKWVSEGEAALQRQQFQVWELGALGSVIDTLAPSVAAGAGDFWTMLFKGAGLKLGDFNKNREDQGQKPLKVRWVLDQGADHCEASSGFFGCPDLAGVYDSWDDLPTVPAGQVTCRGNCRCEIKVVEDSGRETDPSLFQPARPGETVPRTGRRR